MTAASIDLALSLGTAALCVLAVLCNRIKTTTLEIAAISCIAFGCIARASMLLGDYDVISMYRYEITIHVGVALYWGARLLRAVSEPFISGFLAAVYRRPLNNRRKTERRNQHESTD